MATQKEKPKNGPGSVGCHQSFRPILPCGNKVLQQRWDQSYYDEHRKLVKTAKPMVDTKAPPRRNHVESKWKKEQTLQERGEEINRDNVTLLNRMQKIMQTQGCVDHTNSYIHHSLNQEQRQREQDRVARENLDILKRLEDAEPVYKVSKWIDEWQRKEELANMITSFPNGTPLPDSMATSTNLRTSSAEDRACSTIKIESSPKKGLSKKKMSVSTAYSLPAAKGKSILKKKLNKKPEPEQDVLEPTTEAEISTPTQDGSGPGEVTEEPNNRQINSANSSKSSDQASSTSTSRSSSATYDKKD